MKKYIIFTLYTIYSLHGMEQPIIKSEPREWDAKAYDETSIIKKPSFLDFLKNNNIEIKNCTILSAGCGTGRIEAKLAKKASHVHGFDASQHMIEYAQKTYGHNKNLSFELCCAENFTSQELYNLTIASSSIHWFGDKKKALQHISDSLQVNGVFFALVPTTDNPKPISLIVATEVIAYLQNIITSHPEKDLPSLTGQDDQSIVGCSYISHNDLNNILKETGFEIIKSEEQSFDCIMSEDDIKRTHWSIFSSRPFIKLLPDDLVQDLFKKFIVSYTSKLSKTGDEKFLDKIYTTLIHARKIKK
jgi:SAM-dependent methyltransferase